MILSINVTPRVSGFRVKAATRRTITKKAWESRVRLGWDNVLAIPFKELEKRMLHFDPMFYLGVADENEMKDREGITIPNTHSIFLREDVALALEQNSGSHNNLARFTISHEIGHYMLHFNQPIGAARTTSIGWPLYEDSEWQANAFAADFLMPPCLLTTMRNFQEIADAFVVSEESASYQFNKFCK